MGRMLAVNIGDSFITYGLCEEDGSFVEGSRQAVPSHSDGSAYDLINALGQVLEPFQGQVVRVGVSVSCPFDYAHGVFHMTRKFSAMNGHFLRMARSSAAAMFWPCLMPRVPPL